MKILVLPREDTNLYQELLYQQMRRRGARVSYLAVLTPSHTLNLLLLPLELVIRRLGGARVVHLHWVYAFGFHDSSWSKRISEAWFAGWLWTLRLLDMRLVWTAHNVLPAEPVFTDDVRARRRLVAACDLVIAHSQSTLQLLAALEIVGRRSVVIPHGPFTPTAQTPSPRAPGDGQAPRQLLFLGKVRRYKGVDLLLEAFAALPAELDVRLTVAGECGDTSLQDELTELARGSRGRVTLRLERIAESDVTRLLQQADAVVLPYRRITTSGSGVLALCHGRPLVVPDLPGLAELPDDAVVRYDGSVQGLANAITDLTLMDASVLAKMSAAAYAHGAALDWSEIAERTLTAMREIRSDGKRKSHAGA